jgi:hypothetical protein
MEPGRCTADESSISAPMLLSHANMRGMGAGITFDLNHAKVDECHRAKEKRHNLHGRLQAFVSLCVRLCLR